MVNSGVTLTIEAGVEVRIDPALSIKVDGQLIARGTSGNDISFVANQTGKYWGYLIFDDTSIDATYDESNVYVSGSILEYASFDYGGVSTSSYSDAALRVNTSNPHFNQITVTNSATRALYILDCDSVMRVTNSTFNKNGGTIDSRGIVTFSCLQTIGVLIDFSNNIVTDNAWQAVFLAGYKTAIVSGNTIRNNGWGNSYNDQTGLYLASGWGLSSYVADNNIISNNNGAGIVTNASGRNLIRYNIISNNLGNGIFNDENVTVENSIIIDNQSGANDGAGVLATDRFGTTLTGNVIAGNKTTSGVGGGISLTSDIDYPLIVQGNSFVNNEAPVVAAIDIDTSYDSSTNSSAPGYTTDISTNTFINNIASLTGTSPDITSLITIRGGGHLTTLNNNNLQTNNIEYAVANTALVSWNNDLNGTNQWWGTTVDTEVQALIYDFVEDSSTTSVNYAPFLTTYDLNAPISPPAGLSVTPGVGTITLSWRANRESDVAGYIVYWGSNDAPFYENSTNVGNVITHTLSGLAEGSYYVSVTAYDTNYNVTNEIATTLTNDNMAAGYESWYARAVANPLSLSASNHDYGNVYTGSNASQTFTMTNLGYTNYAVTNVALSGTDIAEFAIINDTCTIATITPSESCNISVTMTPMSVGEKSASLIITLVDNQQAAMTVSLTGTALAAADVDVGITSIDLETVVLGNSATNTVAISNRGTKALTVNSLTLSGTNAREFSIIDSCTTITASGNCSITLNYTPITASAKSAMLTIDSDDPDEASINIDLTANAVEPLSINSLVADSLTVTAPVSMAFTTTVSGGSNDYSYNWNFGDGSSSSTQNPSHNFSNAGTYTVILTVTDNNDTNNAATSSLSIAVIDTPIVYSPVGISLLSADVSTSVIPFSTRFNVTANGGSGQYQYLWDFGDGSDDSVEQTPAHTFNHVGEFTVSVTVTVTDSDDANNSTVGQLIIKTIDPPPAYTLLSIDKLIASPSRGVAPMDTTFEVAVSGGSGNYNYSWDFGDNSDPDFNQNPSHQFVEPGVYMATVTVTDVEQSFNSISASIGVTTVAEPLAYSPVRIDQLFANAYVGLAPQSVNFNISASGGSGNYTFAWDFGDEHTGDGFAISNTYALPGDYVVTVTVTDNDDNNNTATGRLMVRMIQPLETLSASIEANILSTTAPFIVTFAANIEGDTAPYQLDWTFGDGTSETSMTNSNIAQQSHTFEKAGVYEVTVAISSANGILMEKVQINTALQLAIDDQNSNNTGGNNGSNETKTGDSGNTNSESNDSDNSAEGGAAGVGPHGVLMLALLAGFRFVRWRKYG